MIASSVDKVGGATAVATKESTRLNFLLMFVPPTAGHAARLVLHHVQDTGCRELVGVAALLLHSESRAWAAMRGVLTRTMGAGA